MVQRATDGLPKGQRHTRIFPDHGSTSERVAIDPYLISANKSMEALLAQEVEGVEQPVYYLNRSLGGTEIIYHLLEQSRKSKRLGHKRSESGKACLEGQHLKNTRIRTLEGRASRKYQTYLSSTSQASIDLEGA